MDPLILALETATLRGSICVVRAQEVLAETVGDPKASHSNTLLSEIDDVLSRAGVSLHDVDVFAVATGPGSFTGLRIGIATAKALAETLGRRIVGVPTLEAVAHSAGPSGVTLSLLPAGRGEVFAQSFSVSDTGQVTPLDQPVHLSPLRMLDRYANYSDLLLAGDAVSVHLEKIRDWAIQHGRAFEETNWSHKGWCIAPSSERLATHVASLALARVTEGKLDQPDALQAIYVRPSDAELKNPTVKST
ncbi:MAG: tRNA (adenosine(37)-N6)-threonylcarbamoyltransferase complex dimerization subunit type 1 TsaB [Blastocatellia bacterium]|nr:MAG: tRNA (adenosine(37)-N6)-threonylcarbamoyltransferase complex dimerization subunit type 1 TsaB [Blastocatellia bacterium]